MHQRSYKLMDPFASTLEVTDNKAMERNPVAHRLYRCKCGRPIFFRNSLCIACRAPLGYDPERGMLYPLRPVSRDGIWCVAGRRFGNDRHYRRCANLELAAGCNWLIPVAAGDAESNAHPLCVACRLNRTIPDLSVEGNPERWRRIEVAKRRLVSSLVRLGLPVASRVSEDPERGLAFDFLSSIPGAPVMTGHENGIITLNIDEAQDSKREQVREAMQEQYRTVLGHLRHESGHYYWQRIVDGTPRITKFREIFGDERQDYGEALERYHRDGAQAGWQQSYVSAYATSHPWEDWAETWAHYLHMTDTLDTAFSFRLELDPSRIPIEEFREDVLVEPELPGIPPFLPLVNGWVQLTAALNELSLSMGLRDFYPFVLSRPAVSKLHFVHLAVYGWRNNSPMPA